MFVQKFKLGLVLYIYRKRERERIKTINFRRVIFVTLNELFVFILYIFLK